MTLYWPADPQTIDLTAPRLHAFIIGVGDYPYLKGGGHPDVANFALPQLTTTTFAAKKIARWLAGKYVNPTVPLGSIEVVLSPSEELERPDGSKVLIEDATMENIESVKNVKVGAFDRWFDRCKSNAGNFALFYFAGHGISTASQYLLLSDFGDPAFNNLWENCIDFGSMRTGMHSNAADTQLFFVDACREKPIDALIQANINGKALCSANHLHRVPDASTYWAAADGHQAYGPADDATYFATAVIEAFEGAGARQRHGQWVVDTSLLGSGFSHVMNVLAEEQKRKLPHNPSPSGNIVELHFPAAPRVRAFVGCQTPQANAESVIELNQGGVAHQSKAGEKRPWTGHLALGYCDIKMTFQNFPPVAVKEKVTPPVFDYTEPV